MNTQFTASQSVDMIVPDHQVPIQHYLRQPKRLVKALVDPTRLEQLGEDCFRLKMRPLQFLMLTLQPTVDLKVVVKPDGTLYLKSQRCEIRGIEYINQRFSLNLVGKLYPIHAQGVTYLKGQADLEVNVELPPSLWFTPKPMLEATGNGLLKSVLLTIKQRLIHNLLADYHHWSAEQMEISAVKLQSGIEPSSQTI